MSEHKESAAHQLAVVRKVVQTYDALCERVDPNDPQFRVQAALLFGRSVANLRSLLDPKGDEQTCPVCGGHGTVGQQVAGAP